MQEHSKPLRISDSLTALVFVVFILIFSAAGLILPDRDFSPQENRYLAGRPALTGQRVLDATYMGEVEEYVTDQFPWRDRWVSFKALCQKWSGQKENNDIYFALGGYLIGKPQTGLPEIAQRNLASVLALHAAGYDAALLVSPMAVEILRYRLPALAYTPEQAELLAQLRQEARDIFVDVEPRLRASDAAGVQVFFRTDHHWTMAGGTYRHAELRGRAGACPFAYWYKN